MKKIELGTDLAQELQAAQAAFVASSEAQVWEFPTGTHVLPTGMVLGAPGRLLKLVGRSTEIQITQGAIELEGGWVDLVDLAFVGEGASNLVELRAFKSTLRRVRVEVVGATADVDALRITGEGSAAAIDCSVSVATTGRGVGVAVASPNARLTRVDVSGEADAIVGIEALAATEAVLSDCRVSSLRGTTSAVGVHLRSSEVEVVGLKVDDLRAQIATGARLFAPAAGTLLALDVTLSGIEATQGRALGLVAGAGGTVSVRGLTALDVKGAPAHAVSCIGNSDIELAAIRVEDVRGQGAGAAGVRVLCAQAASEIALTDVQVDGVGGSSPRAESAPPPALSAWALVSGAALALPGFTELPSFPVGEAVDEVVGVHVGAGVDQVGWGKAQRTGALRVEDVVVHRVAGTALQVEGGLRAALVERVELWTSARAGWVQAEQLLFAEATVHRHLEPLHFGSGEVRLYNSVFSQSSTSAAPVVEEDAEYVALESVFVEGGAPPFLELLDEGELPYVKPGPTSIPASMATGVRPPRVPVDLMVVQDRLSEAPAERPGESSPLHVGARPGDQPLPCHLRDPQPRAWREPAEVLEDDPIVDYKARDARSLLGVMLERARVTMVDWDERGPADMTRMLFEVLADRLDHLAYAQERAVAEGFLDIARLRRSIEDHARPLDYEPDPGLSATVMVRFHVDQEALQRHADALTDGVGPGVVDLKAALEDGGVVEIPAGTLVGNADPSEGSVLFSTEEMVDYRHQLEVVALAEDCPVGATSATLEGRLDELEVGRWLVLSRGPSFPGHVLRVTDVEPLTDTTLIQWDPRRPTTDLYPARKDDEGSRAVVFGNVVPAHHGVPLKGIADSKDRDDLLGAWEALLTPVVDGRATREVVLPLEPVSVHQSGYPLPGTFARGHEQVRVLVEGDEWTLVDDLSLYGPHDEVFVLRSGGSGRTVVRFGDGVNGAALPQREVGLRLDLTVGLGALGNVGAYTIDRLIRFGPVLSTQTDPEQKILQESGQERDDLLRELWRVNNPIPGTGGRDPESLERIRYRAPLRVREALSAVAPRDYERLLSGMPDVAAARVRVVELGIRHLIRVTVLLRDEDVLPEAELLRRWSRVRARLEEIRLLGFDVEVVPPAWVPLDVDLVVDARPNVDPGRLREDVEEALAGNGGLLDPDTVGLGGDVHLSALYQAVQRIRGVEAVRIKRFRRLEQHAPERLADGVIAIRDHEVATLGGPRNPDLGLLTVTVCGGLA